MELKLENPINIIHAYENQEGWHIDDISLSSAGKIAFSGRNYGTHQSFVCIYSSDDNPDSRDQPALLYHKQFADKLSWPRRISFIIPNCTEIITCQNDEVHVIEHNKDEVLRSCRVIGRTTCLSVSENQIFIGIYSSDIVNIYDNDLNEIKSIRLQGIKGDWPGDITAAAEKLYVRTGGYPGKAIAYSQNSGSILTEFTTREDSSHACSTAVNIHLELTAVLWYHLGQAQIIFYHLSENISFLTVNAEPDIIRIRISDRGRIATAGEFPGGVKIYALESVLSYGHLKENLASRLGRDDCEKLTDFLAMEGEELNTILNSDRPAASFLFALEEKSVIQPSNVDRLEKAFYELNMSPSLCHTVDLYKKLRADEITSYDGFLACLSAHLTSLVPAELCEYFRVSGEQKNIITSSQNPGLSLLLVLDEMGIINSSEIGSLEEPLKKMRLVQAVAKIHEYKEMLQEANGRLLETNPHDKKAMFVEFLKRKIKSLYETMTPVPWKKSCQWKSTDLFVGSGLILADSKTKKNVQHIDEKCKLMYTDIFTHEKLKSERRIKLEGDPGAGKTMLLSQLAYDWSEGKINNIDIMIFLPLKIVENKTIIQAVKDFYIPMDRGISNDNIESILATSTETVCFLLDGLEEYSPGGQDGTKESTEVMKIMKGEKHRNCKVVISTRSDFAQNLPECPSLKVGRFGDRQRALYIERVHADSTDHQKKILSIIQNNPFILEICNVPLLFVLVVHNIGSINLSNDSQLNKVSPFMKKIVLTLCSSTAVIHEEDREPLAFFPRGKMSLGELAFNGLCKGHQQLTWQKNFVENNVSGFELWVDSGILVLEDSFIMQEKKAEYTSEIMEIPRKEVSEQPPSHETTQLLAPSELSKNALAATTDNLEATVGEQERQSVSTIETVSHEEKRERGRRNAHQVPLAAKFLHKVIQEWFAATFFSSKMKRFTSKDQLQKYVSSHLQHINPADLHYILRFTSYLHPPSCHVIINYLLRSYRKDGYVPPYIMNCVFLCFHEHNDIKGPDMINAVEDVCKEGITIQSEDSRLLQLAKSSLLDFASNVGVIVDKLELKDVIHAVDETGLTLDSGAQLGNLNTVKFIEVGRWDQGLKAEDYKNILKFLSTCKLMEEVRLFFPSKPPDILDETTLSSITAKDMKVEWHIGRSVHSLNSRSGKWKMNFKQPFSSLTEIREVGGDRNIKLRARRTISQIGGTIKIPDSRVMLRIPPKAFWEDNARYNIEMKVIPRGVYDEPAKSFTDNSSVMVELLPNNLSLRRPAELTLPHCLQLRRVRRCSVRVYVSHHDVGNRPIWKDVTNTTNPELSQNDCKIRLKRFCWVKYEIDGEEVEAKKLIVYTAGHKCKVGTARVIIDVGYYPEMIGANELFDQKQRSSFIADKQPFLFRKEPKVPLEITLTETNPDGWKTTRSSSSPKTISYFNIASSNEQSRPFVFERQTEVLDLPFCSFILSQDEEFTELVIDMAENGTRDDEMVLKNPNEGTLSRPQLSGAMRTAPVDLVNKYEQMGLSSMDQQPQSLPSRPRMTSLISNAGETAFSMTQGAAVPLSPPSLSPTSSPVYNMITFRNISTLAMYLDPADNRHNDWRKLADRLQFKMNDIALFGAQKSPTIEVIDTAMKCGFLESKSQLIDILKGMEREDAAKAISD